MFNICPVVLAEYMEKIPLIVLIVSGSLSIILICRIGKIDKKLYKMRHDIREKSVIRRDKLQRENSRLGLCVIFPIIGIIVSLIIMT